jgi:hypothetical protein
MLAASALIVGEESGVGPLQSGIIRDGLPKRGRSEPWTYVTLPEIPYDRDAT